MIEPSAIANKTNEIPNIVALAAAQQTPQLSVVLQQAAATQQKDSVPAASVPQSTETQPGLAAQVSSLSSDSQGFAVTSNGLKAISPGAANPPGAAQSPSTDTSASTNKQENAGWCDLSLSISAIH